VRRLGNIVIERNGFMSWIKERFSLLGIVLIGFLMGAMFVAGGVAAYNLYVPRQVSAENVKSAEEVKIGPADISQTVENVSSAVVNIEPYIEEDLQMSPYFNDPFFREFFGDRFDTGRQTRRSKGVGTGIIFDQSGLILTNEHVIHGASDIDVKITGFDKPVKATVVGSDRDLDLAVLKVSVNKDLPVLKLGDSNKIEVGSWVIAIGNPYGLDHTVTVGVISAKGRPVTISNRLYKNLLQTDAAINPGNSGGPLLNTAGEVIGINTAVTASAQGIGFAIPIGTVKEVLNDLIKKGKVIKPYLGVILQPLDEELAQYFGAPNTDGALVSYVAPGSPAEKAGMLKGDVIIEINKNKLKTPDDVTEAVKKAKVGASLIVQILRDGHSKSVTVKAGEKP